MSSQAIKYDPTSKIQKKKNWLLNDIIVPEHYPPLYLDFIFSFLRFLSPLPHLSSRISLLLLVL